MEKLWGGEARGGVKLFSLKGWGEREGFVCFGLVWSVSDVCVGVGGLWISFLVVFLFCFCFSVGSIVRMTVVDVLREEGAEDSREGLRGEVRRGLLKDEGMKALPSWLFYDDEGSGKWCGGWRGRRV